MYTAFRCSKAIAAAILINLILCNASSEIEILLEYLNECMNALPFLRRFTKPIEVVSEDIYFNSSYSDCYQLAFQLSTASLPGALMSLAFDLW